MLSVSLLGNFCIKHDETPVKDVDSPRLQSLLAYLILHRQAPQPRAYLAYLFWPDTSETQARTNLRNLLHHLRRLLPEADTYLDASGQALQWRSGSLFSLDVDDFEAALAQVEQAQKTGNSAAVRQALEQAAALYKGDLLPSCYDDWIIPLREGLRQSYLGALEKLVDMLEERRDYQAAIRSAQRLLRLDPLHEATYRRLIRLHALHGDRVGGLRVYHACTTILQRELDVEPGPATREAYEQLLGTEAQIFPTRSIPAATSLLVGREREWTEILAAWHTAITNRTPHVVILCGEAGIGKTRLVEELLQWAARQGIASTSARCYAAEGELAFAPVTTWLRSHPLPPIEDVWLAEVARLLPEILVKRSDIPRPMPLTEAWQRQRLFEALSRTVLGLSQPLLNAIDDLQWCDRDTLEWLHFHLRFDPQASLLVVGAYRPEEIQYDHPLASWLQALRSEGLVTEVDLQPLDQISTQVLAAQVAGEEIDTAAAQMLYRETEGNPLFVVETVRAGLPVLDHRTGVGAVKPRLDSLSGDKGLPPRVRSVLEARLAQLTPPTRELAGLAAAIGREFAFRLLASASGCHEDALVHQIDELWQRRIVREHGSDAYDFSHDKLREVAYSAMSTARRRLLHRQIALALESLHAAQLDSVSHQVAAHYERAGLPDQAVPYYLRAAEVARRVFANDEAISLLERGLALVESGGSSVGAGLEYYEVPAQLWEALGDILELKADHTPALQAYQKAQSLVPQAERIWQARLYRKSGIVLREQRLYAQALEAGFRAEEALGSQPEGDSPGWWDEWLDVQVDQVWARYWLARWPEMEALVNRLWPIVEKRGKPLNRMRFLRASLLMRMRRERYVVSDEMLADSRESLALCQEWGDMKSRVEHTFELGFLHLWRHELDQAEGCLLDALELVESFGSVPMRALTLTYLTVVCRFRGQIEGVSDYAQRALEIAQAAQMPDYVATARGNQAWLAWRRHDLPAAQIKGREALELWQHSPLVYPFQWIALFPLIGIALAQNRQVEAWDHVRVLLEPTQQLLPEALNAALEAALHSKTSSQPDEARLHLDRAVELAAQMGYL